MSDSVDRVFAHALQTVRKIPKTGTARPPAEDRLRLYGLYKQSMEGDVNGVMDRPEGNGDEARAEREKWDAWNAQSGLPKTEAKRRYIATLIETMHKYASSTPESRSLVSELEFVWDQIRPPTSTHPHAAISGLHVTSTPIGGTTELGIISPNPYGEHEVTGSSDHSGDEDASPLKWRLRVEQALAKMATELAALREGMEGERVEKRHRRLRAAGNWVGWVLWVMGRQVLVEVVLWVAVVVWLKGRGERRVMDALRVLGRCVLEEVKKVRVWRRR